MDVYASNLVQYMPKKIEFQVVQQKYSNLSKWVLHEFIYPKYPLEIRLKNVDLYHAISQVGAKAAWISGSKPLITTVHDLIPNSMPLCNEYYKINSLYRRILNPWYYWFLKKSDHLIATSMSCKNDIIRILNVNPDKISVVHYGVDKRKFKPRMRSEYNDPKNILYIGALQEGKGILTLIKAFNILLKDMGDVNLLIGGRGNMLNEIKTMIIKMGIEDNVKLLGFIPDEKLSQIYNLSDVFVFPSYYGFHLMMLDAMATGLPVIVNNILDAKEYVEGAGRLVHPGSVVHLAKTMKEILSNRKLYEELSLNAINKTEYFNCEAMVHATLRVYRNVLNEYTRD